MPILISPEQRKLAYNKTAGKAPGIMFLGGFRSDMTGNKALALEALCKENGHAFVRFDYSGHGESEGDFAEGTITRWFEDALAIFDSQSNGKQILVGSSMGGWLMTRLALTRPDRIHALVGIAAAPDFTIRRMWPQMSQSQQAEILEKGVIHVPSDMGGTYPITKALIDSGNKESVFGMDMIPINCPVRLLHGTLDDVVPTRTSYEFAEKMVSADVQIMMVNGGDHRLSREEDITLLSNTVSSLLGLQNS
ncbi:MAG: alpha/beta hydrolase [Rickettsiales bacterium]